MQDKITRVGVGLYLFNDKHQLLLGLRKSSHGNGTWCPPGGHMEFGESNEQAAIREAKEETGLEVLPENVRLLGVTNDFFEESGKHYITLNLGASDFSGSPRVMEPDKCAEWRWFDLDRLPENLFLSAKNFLKNYHI